MSIRTAAYPCLSPICATLTSPYICHYPHKDPWIPARPSAVCGDHSHHSVIDLPSPRRWPRIPAWSHQSPLPPPAGESSPTPVVDARVLWQNEVRVPCAMLQERDHSQFCERNSWHVPNNPQTISDWAGRLIVSFSRRSLLVPLIVSPPLRRNELYSYSPLQFDP